MLSAATLSYLSPQEDVNEQQIDALVEYAATKHPDAKEAFNDDAQLPADFGNWENITYIEPLL